MNWLIFQNSYELFQFFFCLGKYFLWKKNLVHNREIVSSITQKILMCNVESWYKNMSKIRDATSIYKNFRKIFSISYKVLKINKLIWTKKKDKSPD